MSAFLHEPLPIDVGEKSGQVRPYVRPVARRLPLAIMYTTQLLVVVGSHFVEDSIERLTTRHPARNPEIIDERKMRPPFEALKSLNAFVPWPETKPNANGTRSIALDAVRVGRVRRLAGLDSLDQRNDVVRGDAPGVPVAPTRQDVVAQVPIGLPHVAHRVRIVGPADHSRGHERISQDPEGFGWWGCVGGRVCFAGSGIDTGLE